MPLLSCIWGDLVQKKSLRRIVAGTTAALLLSFPSAALADKGSDLQSQLTAAQNQIQQMKDQINADKSQQDELVNQITQVDSNISDASNQVLKLKNELAQKIGEKTRTQNQLDGLNKQIAQTGRELDADKVKLAKQREVLSERVKRIYKLGKPSYYAVLFNTSSFADFVNRVRFLLMIQAQDHRLVKQVEAAKSAVEARQRQQEQAKQVAEAKQAVIAYDARRIQQLEIEEESRLALLRTDQAQRRSLVDKLKQEQAAMLSQVQEEQAKANALAEELNQWNARLAAEAKAAAAAQAAAAMRAAAATQAAVQQASQPPTGSAKGRLGVDYSIARPGGAAIKGSGYAFVARYLSSYPEKNLSAVELSDLRANGLAIVLVWEDTANRALDGYGAGLQDAYIAQAQADLLGAPSSAPIYFAVDFAASAGQQGAIDDYLRGAASVLGLERVGVYGSYYVVKRSFDNGTATFGWQAVAWSDGWLEPRAHIYQNGGLDFNGGADIDVAMQDYIGQWY